MRRALLAISGALARLESAVLLVALFAMLAAVLISIVARFVGANVPWVTPGVLALMIVATFSGASLATAQRRHITMDLLGKALSQRARTALGILTGLVATTLCAVLTAAGSRWVHANMSYDDPISLALKIPDWYLQAVVPIGFGLMGTHFLINILLDIGGLVSGDFSYLPETGGLHAPLPPSEKTLSNETVVDETLNGGPAK